jgi:hypothetical protein
MNFKVILSYNFRFVNFLAEKVYNNCCETLFYSKNSYELTNQYNYVIFGGIDNSEFHGFSQNRQFLHHMPKLIFWDLTYFQLYTIILSHIQRQK